MPALALLIAAGLRIACAADLVDPTQPPPGYAAAPAGAEAAAAPGTPAPEPIRLQMVARSGSARLAVVNGQRVRAGDSLTLDGKRVTVAAIREDSVVLLRDGRRDVLELIPRPASSPGCAAHSPSGPSCRGDLPGASR